ncbi:TetR family transcriptional regulator [Nocardia sp. NPDC005978]|uniref:TetR/AcrR family transcriptional regulator n=1 Tax=Nocardia sp. NPDC005978 TaxID=3156725 RepID=UPI0033B69BFA
MARMNRAESRAHTRNALVRAARDLFVAEGPANTSLARVAEAAGYSKGAVYSNFQSKNELCLEVLELIHAENAQRAEAAAATVTAGSRAPAQPAAEGLKDFQTPPQPTVEDLSTGRGGARTALLAAAVDIFTAQRFDEVSTTEIARRAGVAIGLITYHFGGKRGLYLAAAEAVATEFWESLRAMRGPAVPRLVRGLDLYFDHAERYLGSPLAPTARATDPELRAIHERYFDQLVNGLLQEVSGGPGTALIRASVAGWLGFVEGVVAEWLRTRELTREQVRELLLANFFGTAQAVLSMDPGTPLSSRAITALFDHSRPGHSPTAHALDDETEHDR